MKKRIVLLLFATVLLAGCGTQKPAATDSQPEPVVTTTMPATDLPTDATEEVTEVPTETVELSYDAYQVLYTYMEEDDQEYYILQGIDHQGNLLWSKETQRFDKAEVQRVSHIGTYEGKYIYNENGNVIALDVITGELVWKNEDFGGNLSADTGALIDDAGFIYLCGALGPDFIAIDSDGNTVKKVEQFSQKHSGAYQIEQKDDKLIVHLSKGPDIEKSEYLFEVEMDWIPEPLG